MVSTGTIERRIQRLETQQGPGDEAWLRSLTDEELEECIAIITASIDASLAERGIDRAGRSDKECLDQLVELEKLEAKE